MLGKIESRKEKGMTEEEMVGWCHRLHGLEFEQIHEVGDGQRSLSCCTPWGCKESDMTEQLNSNKGRNFPGGASGKEPA